MKPKELDLRLFDQGYDVQTELLTTRGWAKFTDLRNDDRAFVWTKEGKLGLEKVPECYTRMWEGKMHRLINRHIDIFCMPGTRIVARVRPHTRQPKEDEWSEHRVENIKDSWQLEIPVTGIWEGTQKVLPKVAYATGLWCSGVLTRDTPKFSPETAKLLHKIVENRNFDLLAEVDHKRIAKQMSEARPDRELTWDMLLWDIEARKQLILGLMDGRGRRYPPAAVFIFMTNQENRADIFQALTMSIGWRSHISLGNGVFFAHGKGTSSIFFKHRKVPTNFKGDPQQVWNIRADTGQMVIRRDQKIAIASTL